MSITTKGRLFTVSNDLLVHCLDCDNTYRENEEILIGCNNEEMCPYCLNQDTQRTVYVEETDND